MPTLPSPCRRSGTVIGALFALACLWPGADVASAQSMFRRPSLPMLGSTRAAAAPAAAPAARPAAAPAGRPTAGPAREPARPATPVASPSGGRGRAPSATGATRSDPTAPSVVRADGASAGGAASSGGVVQAGRVVASADCRHCGRRGCNACRPGAGRVALACNGRCDAGGCPAHCPVRPEHFGYYPTQWRSWPGQGVQQVAHFDPATTPVVPPRSQLPTLEEESGAAPEEDAEEAGPVADAPASPAATLPAAGPPRADAPAALAPADDAGGRRPALGADDAMPEAPGADGPQPEPDGAGDGAAVREAAPPDAASVLLAPRRAVPARPASAWRPNGTPRDRRGEETPATAPLDSDGGDLRSLTADPAPGAAATTGNPLRPAEQASAFHGPARDRRPRSVATEGWRPARREADGGDAEATLRGVTANPGNPLR